MGTIICDIPKEKITFDKIELFLNKTINDKELEYSRKNNSIVYNLYCEYNELKSQSTQQKYQFSKLGRNIKNFRPLKKLKKIFLEWFHILYDTKNIEFTANELYRLKSENFSLETYFKKNLKKTYKNHKDYFLKLVSKGIPSRLRAEIWTIILDNEEQKDVSSSLILLKSTGEEENEFLDLLSQNDTSELKQICKDISRTFTDERHQTDSNMKLLKDILIALTNLDKNLGYCQGINFIVGFLLRLTNFSKIKTYHLSKLIIPKIKNYYTENFPKLQQNLKLFNENFKYFYPKLYKHFQENGLVNELFAGKWIQTLFTICVPFNELCMIWDTLLVYGFNFVVFISLAILDHTEKELLKLQDSSDIMEFLKNTLNPNSKNLKQNIYNDYVDDVTNYIIPLSDIILTAKKIKTNYENNIQNIVINNKGYIDKCNKYNSNLDLLKIIDKKPESSTITLSTADEVTPIKNSKSSFSSKNNNILNGPNYIKCRITNKTKINRHKDNNNIYNTNSNELTNLNVKKLSLQELKINDNNYSNNYDSSNSSLINHSLNFTKPDSVYNSSKTVNTFYNSYNTISSLYDLENKNNNNNQYPRYRDVSSNARNNYVNNLGSNYRNVDRSSNKSLNDYYHPYNYNCRRLSNLSDGINYFGRCFNGFNGVINRGCYGREVLLFSNGTLI